MKTMRALSILLVAALVMSLLGTVTFAQQEQLLTPITDMEAAAGSEIPMYLYAEDGYGIRHYMRQAKSAAASSHGYKETVTTTSPYSLYTTTDIDESPVYSLQKVSCDSAADGASEYMLQLYDTAANTNYILYLRSIGVGPNKPADANHTKHHLVWDGENQYFYRVENSVTYVLAMKNMQASYAAAGTLPAMSQNEWRITCVRVSELENADVYPVILASHTHSYSVPVQVYGDAENHRLDCACGAEGTQKQTHSYGDDGSCVCGKRESVLLEEGIYYLKGTVGGTTYYFRQTGSGEKVTYTTPYSLYTTTAQASATLVDVIRETTGGFSLGYPYNTGTARIYVYDVGNNSTVDTGVNTANVEVNHHFQWDAEAQLLYQLESQVKYVLAMKELKNSNTGANEFRVLAVPESELSATVVPVKLEAHTRHSCDTWVIDTPATTGASGLKTGICTICDRQIQEVIPAITPAFCGKSISLQDDFSISFYVEKAAFADGVYQNPYVVFRVEDTQITVSDYAQKEDCYVFTLGHITPDKLGQTVTATLYADKQDGTQFSVTASSGVAEYCYASFDREQTGDTLRRLLVDTLNFGAACQRYNNSAVAAEELVNGALTDEQRAWGSDGDLRKLESCRSVGRNTGEVRWYGASALLENRVQMRVYFIAEDATDLTVQAVSAGGQWTLDDIKTKGGLYYIDFDKLNPAQMNEKVSFTVYRKDTALSSTMDYSLESYAAVWTQKASARPEQVELVKAMIRYGDSAKAYVERVYDLQENVRYLGRTYESAGAQWFNWSASGFSVRFQGSGLQAKIASNAPNAKNYAYLKVYVDGVEQTDILLDKTVQTVTLAQGLDPEKTHIVEVRKRNSPNSSTAGLLSVELLDGTKLAPAEAKDKLIEFIGDSLTVGYSAADVNKTETAWSTATEDATKTYSKPVADAFDAEYMVTAISGRGVVMNNSGGSGYTLPDVYPELDIYNIPGVSYDFALQPDVIVINLGTNDATNSGLDIAAFQAGAYGFIKTVRENNPQAQIIWAYGLRNDKKTAEVAAAIQAAVAQLNTEGDSKVHYVSLPLAADMHLNHPTAAAYAPSAEVLTEKIAEITGW